MALLDLPGAVSKQKKKPPHFVSTIKNGPKKYCILLSSQAKFSSQQLSSTFCPNTNDMFKSLELEVTNRKWKHFFACLSGGNRTQLNSPSLLEGQHVGRFEILIVAQHVYTTLSPTNCPLLYVIPWFSN